MNAFRPFMKAVAPAVLTLVAVGVDWLVNGTFNTQTGAIAITGLVSAVVTYFVPNTTAPPATATVAVESTRPET